MDISKRIDALRVSLSIGVSLAVAIAMIALISSEPITALRYFIIGPIDSIGHIGNVVEMAIPLVFTGLYYVVLFRSNLFNLGAEGIFFSSALLAGVLAVNTSMPAVLHPLVLILLGGLLGAVLGCIPCLLKVKWDANTLVISLMMNYILYGVSMYFLNNKFRDVNAYAIETHTFQDTARLSRMIPGTRIHWGIIIMIVVCIALTILINKTKWGYELRMMGINKRFADYVGMSSVGIMFLVHSLAGGLAGLGGAVEILGMYNKFKWSSLPGYGLDGALIALLAKSNPKVVPFAALFIAYIRNGADMMARMSDVPSEMISVVQALIILLISSQALLQGYKERQLLKEAKANG